MARWPAAVVAVVLAFTGQAGAVRATEALTAVVTTANGLLQGPRLRGKRPEACHTAIRAVAGLRRVDRGRRPRAELPRPVPAGAAALVVPGARRGAEDEGRDAGDRRDGGCRTSRGARRRKPGAGPRAGRHHPGPRAGRRRPRAPHRCRSAHGPRAGAGRAAGYWAGPRLVLDPDGRVHEQGRRRARVTPPRGEPAARDRRGEGTHGSAGPAAATGAYRPVHGPRRGSRQAPNSTVPRLQAGHRHRPRLTVHAR